MSLLEKGRTTVKCRFPRQTALYRSVQERRHRPCRLCLVHTVGPDVHPSRCGPPLGRLWAEREVVTVRICKVMKGQDLIDALRLEAIATRLEAIAIEFHRC